MRIDHFDPNAAKGWYAGPWNSDLPVSIGYANAGIDEPHLHAKLTEIYLVAHGWSDVRIEHKTIRLVAGDMLVVEPGEAHSFLANSPDYLHFVLHVPGMSDTAANSDKVAVPRSRLRLGS